MFGRSEGRSVDESMCVLRVGRWVDGRFNIPELMNTRTKE